MMKKTNSSDDAFELITAKDTITSDKQYVQSQLMRLLKSDPITIEEKGVMINHMHHKDLRAVLQQVLHEINSPKSLSSLECLKELADILKFNLTLFVHEDSNDYKLLYSILDSSHHIYHMTKNKRKLYLYTLLDDHGIWHGDAHNWRECIVEIVAVKV